VQIQMRIESAWLHHSELNNDKPFSGVAFGFNVRLYAKAEEDRDHAQAFATAADTRAAAAEAAAAAATEAQTFLERAQSSTKGARDQAAADLQARAITAEARATKSERLADASSRALKEADAETELARLAWYRCTRTHSPHTTP